MRLRPASVLVLAATFAAFATPAFAGSAFDLFRVPDHRAHHYDATAGGQLRRTGQNASGATTLAGASGGSFLGHADWLRDSDARQWSIDATGSFSGSRDHRETAIRQAASSSEADDLRRYADELVSLGAGWREYPTSLPLAIELAAIGSLSRTQVWEHSSTANQTYSGGSPLSGYESADGRWGHRYVDQVSGSAAVGWGRVRDASAVHTAWVLEQRWLADHAITRPLTDEEVAKLAGLISLRDDYASAHQRPEKAFWADVESALREMGVLAGDELGAYAGRHALDPEMVPGATWSRRYVGYFVGPYFDVVHTRESERIDDSHAWRSGFSGAYGPWTESRFSSYDVTYRDDPRVGVVGTLHRALGMRTHVDASLDASADARGLRRYTNVLADATVRHWLADRWLADARIQQRRMVARGGDSADLWESYATAELQYFIEDHWSASVIGSFDRTMGYVPQHESMRVANLTFSIGWNRGALDAPGLIGPVRPLD